MAANEWEAIKSRWDDAHLTTAITGGVWDGRAPERTAFPYCEFDLLGNSPFLWTNRAEYETFGFGLKVYGQSKRAALAGAELVKAAFDHAPLTMTAGTLLKCRRESGPIVIQEDKGAWSGTLTYSAQWRKAANYSPAVPSAPDPTLLAED